MIETNSSCNLDCSFCNRGFLESTGRRDFKNISTAEFVQVLELFADCPIDTIKLEGLSEPMMHPFFDQLARELRRAFPQAFVIIASNLQYNIDKTPFYKTLPLVDMVYLSIDGIGEVYERARSGASFPRLVKSLDEIKKNVPLEVRKKKLFINFTASPDNIECLPEVYKLKDNYNFNSVRINIAQNWNEHEKNSIMLSERQKEILKKYRDDLKGVPLWEYKNCFWPFNGVVIDVYGDIRQCIINTSQNSIANVFKDDIKKIYNENAIYMNAREQLNRNEAPLQCRNCDYNLLGPLLAEIVEDKALFLPARKIIRKELINEARN